MGVIVAVIAFFVFVGGMKRIAKVTETIVPVMAALYIVGALIVIIANWRNIPYAFHAIVVGAFNPSAISGGAVGATVKLALTKGVARGLFSNEAGMGSTPHAHAVAKVNHPVEQGFVAMTGVFIDTFIVSVSYTHLSKGDFRQVQPDIVFEETNLVLIIGEGEVYRGCLLYTSRCV